MASHLWPPLVGFPLAKMIQVHYDFMVKYSKPHSSSFSKNDFWFFQYMDNDNGDDQNNLPPLGMQFK
jgi:hypothetical protein